MIHTVSRTLKIVGALIAVLLVFQMHVFSQMKKLSKKVNNLTPHMKTMDLLGSSGLLSSNLQLPPILGHIPYADETGIILSTHRVNVPFIETPYNASLIEQDDHYLLFFRYDTPLVNGKDVPFHTHIGSIRLDPFFHPMDAQASVIQTQSAFSEDARVFKANGDYFLAYNDIVPEEKKYRGIRIAHLDMQTHSVRYITPLSRRMNKIEKNWMPFEHKDKGIHLVYSIHPHQILQLPRPDVNDVIPITLSQTEDLSSYFAWETVWGQMRGGTPPRLVDGEYLSFFHSAFRDERGFVWYVMGAYTFEAEAPFRITKMSPHPILYRGAYEAPIRNTANPRVRTLYPVSFVAETRFGKEVIQLSCGENDSCVKILTIDKDSLLKSLKPVL